jgi:Rrf2 family iron-sulfur cluster assembly transcriptional regulator
MAKMGKNGSMVSINSLSETEQISSVFLEQIFFKLKKAGVVNSIRGPGGGFCFAKPLDKLTVKEILDASGEELEAGSCDKRSGNCARLSECESHQVWLSLLDLINNYLRSLTLAKLLEGEGTLVKHEVS